MSTSLKAGVIGLGLLGREHVSTLHGHEAAEVVAVADLIPEAGEKVANETGAQAYTDYAEMLSKHALDYVVIATPDWAHREPALAAVESGAPAVLLEKPLATTMADADAVFEAAEKHKTRFFVNFANRATKGCIATRYMTQSGLLGRAIHGEVRLDDNISVPTQLWGGKSKDWADGSSPLHFLLSHVVDLLRWLFSPAEVNQVFAVSQSGVLGDQPEVYDALLGFDSGLKVRVKSEWIKHIEGLVEFYLCFTGSEGTVIHNRRPGFGVQESWRANLTDRVSAEGLLGHQEALKSLGVNLSALWLRPAPTAGFLSSGEGQTIPALESREPDTGDMREVPRAVIAALLEGTDEPACWKGLGPLPSHVDGLKQTRVCAAIAESAQSGEPVDLT